MSWARSSGEKVLLARDGELHDAVVHAEPLRRQREGQTALRPASRLPPHQPGLDQVVANRAVRQIKSL